MSAAQIQQIQKQLDNNEIDINKLPDKERQVLDKAIEAGIIKGPTLNTQEYLQAKTKSKIANEAQDAGTMEGIDVPIIGTMFNERADYELVGDVIGSFTPYIMNREAIAKDLAKGVKGEKFIDPQGKEKFKLDKFIKSSSKFQRAVSKVVGRRFGAVGRLMPRLASRLENTTRKTAQFTQQMAPKSVGGGGGFSDPAQSLLRTGALTEAQSLALGATGAAAGSVAYDIANFASNVGSDSLLDLNEITEDDYKKLPQPAQMMVDAGAAFANSAVFGVAGTTAGYYAVRMGRSGLRRLLGVNNPETLKLAKLAKEKGMELNIAQLAQDSGTGSLFKNFFKILGVTPFIGGAGRQLTSKQLAGALGKTLEEAETLAPFSFAELLGSEGTNQIRKNYFEKDRLINLQYRQLNKTVEANGNFRFVPTTSTKEEFRKTLRDIYGEDDFAALTKMLKDDKATKVFTDVDPALITAMRSFSGSMKDMKFDYTTFLDIKRFREAINNMTKQKDFQSSKSQPLLTRFKIALDHDLAAAEKVGDEVFERREVMDSLRGNSVELAKQKMKGYQKLLTNANKTYFDLTSVFETGLAERLRRGLGGSGKGEDFLTPRMINSPQVATTAKEQFDAITKNVLRSNDAETIKQFKDLIGVNATQNPELKKYADGFVKKLASRHIFDSFMSALDPIAKESIVSGSLLAVRDKLKDQGLTGYKYIDEMIDPKRVSKTDQGTLAEQVSKISEEYITVPGPKGTLNKIKNPNYIKDELVRKQIEESIAESSKKIDFTKFDLIGGDFNYTKFAQNLGLGEQVKEDALRELIGKEAFGNFRDTVTILKQASTMGFTDPSTYLQRRAGLKGTEAVVGLGSGMLVYNMAGGLIPSIMTAVLGRRVGAIVSDPKKSSALLGLLTEQERKYLMDPQNVKFPFTGPGQKGILGVVDPTQPLGKYFGPKRARNLAIGLNFLDDENKDQIKLDPDKISINDVNAYIDRLGTIDTPQFNAFQLPDKVLEKVSPEVLYFKYAKPEEQDKILETIKGNLNAVGQNTAADQELEAPQPQNLDQNVLQPEEEVSQAMPEQPTQTQQNTPSAVQKNLQSYSFLFPGDSAGQAIAQNQGQKIG